MTEKEHRAVAIEGTPDTPCGMARLLVETDDGLISVLTSECSAVNGMTREEFCDLANEGFATWFSPEIEAIEVEKDWYALYLTSELVDALGGFNNALGLSLQLVDEQPNGRISHLGEGKYSLSFSANSAPLRLLKAAFGTAESAESAEDAEIPASKPQKSSSPPTKRYAPAKRYRTF